MKTRLDALTGVLLGTALGDALGLPAEGLSAACVARRFGALDRFRLAGRTGYVSDDTEQSALVAAALVVGRHDDALAIRALRRGLVRWFARLPFGLGFGTLRACVRMALGFRAPGVRSAGNGAAMRAAIVGAWLTHDAARRRRLGRALAELTHRDARAVDGALFVAEVAALATAAPEDADRARLCTDALGAVGDPALRSALERSIALASSSLSDFEAAGRLGTSGYVLHSVPVATLFFCRHGHDPLEAARAAVRAGGDTDSNAAIAGALAGALRGASALPAGLLAALHDGPFGPAHLRALASALADTSCTVPPRFSSLAALGRNLALFPVVLAHGLRRLAPG